MQNSLFTVTFEVPPREESLEGYSDPLVQNFAHRLYAKNRASGEAFWDNLNPIDQVPWINLARLILRCWIGQTNVQL